MGNADGVVLRVGESDWIVDLSRNVLCRGAVVSAPNEFGVEDIAPRGEIQYRRRAVVRKGEGGSGGKVGDRAAEKSGKSADTSLRTGGVLVCQLGQTQGVSDKSDSAPGCGCESVKKCHDFGHPFSFVILGHFYDMRGRFVLVKDKDFTEISRFRA